MELTYQWFWLVQYTLLTLVLYTIYKAVIVHKLKSKVWNVATLVLSIVAYMAPIKMQPTTNHTNIQSDRQIAISKTLPAKEVDNSFKNSTIIPKITQEDLK